MTTSLSDLANFPHLPDALCREAPPEMFFPDVGDSGAAAKALCGLCPERSACLAWALENCEPDGIWGGLGERQRRRLRRLSQPCGTFGAVQRHRRYGEPLCEACQRVAS